MSDVEHALERALQHGEEGDWESAAGVLRDALEAHGDEPAVHCWLGVAERELGMDGIAYERFRRAIALGPEDPYVLATAGNGVAAFDDPEAEAALRTAALIAPDLPVTRLLYGAWLAREGMHEDARRELAAARGLDPTDPQIAYELGVARALAGATPEALDAVGDAVALDPEDGWARSVFGLLLLEDGRPDEAAGELESAARLQPEEVDLQLAAALALAGAGRDDAAWEMLERARLHAGPDDVARVGLAEERLDQAEEAARLLRDEVAPELLRIRLQARP